MPYSTQHLYLTFGGDLPGGEFWQCGLRRAVPTGATYGDGGSALGFEAAADAVEDWFTSAGAGISPRATLTWVKQAALGTDGHYLESPEIREINPPLVGASSSEGGVVPNQIALVVTLLTGTSFGDAQRGRIYTPMPAVIPGTDGLITTTAAQSRADAAADFVAAVNAAGTGVAPERVVVMSQKGTGTTRLVTSVRVGRALDTHRTRRENLPEDYADASL